MLKMSYSSKRDIEIMLHDFNILFVYNSNKIENQETSYQDVREVFENGIVTGFSGDTRTLFEIQNQKKCYEFLLDKLVEKEEISVEFIKQIHKILTEGTYDENRYVKGERPGEFKKGDYIVGADEVGSSSENVEREIEELVKEINENDSNDYLLIGAYMHCRFEAIHPFADGNGRVGRTLLNYYFMISGFKPLVIYDEDKKMYYECLQAYDKNDVIKPMMKFLEYSQIKTWEKKKKEYKKLVSFL